ncbi:MAG TPA: AAA family ATPase [Acholeplasmataceae bacterium]|nr:AAA family ATPase [Acholeplasmataceae bacterium]
MKIYLIGLPGSGKTTIGKILADEISYNFIDLDGLVEKNALMFIDEIIDRYGRSKYQELETIALNNIKEQLNTVIACGEGIVEDLNNKTLMNGVVVLLDVELPVIGMRLENDNYREILKEQTLEELDKQRFLKYRNFADVIINNNHSIKETINNILEYVNIKR